MSNPYADYHRKESQHDAMDRVQGAAKDAVGPAKEEAGQATDNEDLEAEGTADKGGGEGAGPRRQRQAEGRQDQERAHVDRRPEPHLTNESIGSPLFFEKRQ